MNQTQYYRANELPVLIREALESKISIEEKRRFKKLTDKKLIIQRTLTDLNSLERIIKKNVTIHVDTFQRTGLTNIYSSMEKPVKGKMPQRFKELIKFYDINKKNEELALTELRFLISDNIEKGIDKSIGELFDYLLRKNPSKEYLQKTNKKLKKVKEQNKNLSENFHLQGNMTPKFNTFKELENEPLKKRSARHDYEILMNLNQVNAEFNLPNPYTNLAAQSSSTNLSFDLLVLLYFDGVVNHGLNSKINSENDMDYSDSSGEIFLYKTAQRIIMDKFKKEYLNQKQP